MLPLRTSTTVSWQPHRVPAVASFFERGRPVENDGDGLRSCRRRIYEKPVAARCDIPPEGIYRVITDLNRCREERFRDAGFERRANTDVCGNQFSVQGQVEELLAVAPPARLVTAVGRNFCLAACAGRYRESLHPDLRSARLVRDVRHPVRVG